ncbi:MAG: zf-HC2 domain-containing protein [Acidobacteriota bacterium]
MGTESQEHPRDEELRRLVAEAAPQRRGDCPEAEDLVSLADGVLADEARRRVEDHLALCTPCTGIFAGLQRVDQLGLRAPGPEQAQGLLDRLAALVSFELPPSLAVAARGAAAVEVDEATDLYRQGMELYRGGQVEEAQEMLSRAHAAGESSAELLLYLGACSLHLGWPEEARGHLVAAVQAAPKLGELRWYLAQAELLLGSGDAALEQLKAAGKLPGPQKSESKKLATELKILLASESD